MKLKKLTCLLLLYTFWINLLAPFVHAQNAEKPEEKEKKGLEFRLRQGATKAEQPVQKTDAPITNLTGAEADAIFRRLPEMPAETTEKSDFKMRGESLPAPKAGKIIQAKFPADETENAPNVENSATLEVVRYTPSGAVSIVPELSVTFSQAMINISSQTETSENIPVILTPPIKGKWRWLGTKTLIFDAGERFPMATKFSAVIPAGTKSAVGGTLEKEIAWNFETPPPKVENFLPQNSTVTRNALILAKFDQKINAEAILSKITATANNQEIALKIASKEEIAADQKMTKAIKDFLPERFIVFRAAELFPPDSRVNIIFEKDLPSAEGELKTTQEQKFSFKTYGALKFEKFQCGYDADNSKCEPSDNFYISFNNPLNEESFDQSLVKIEPEIEDANISVSENRIEILQRKAPRTKYKISISGALKDNFGQTLGKDISAETYVGAEEPDIFSEGGNFITLDPNGKRFYSILSKNFKKLHVKLYAVAAEDYTKYQKLNEENISVSPDFGKLVFDKQIKLKTKEDATEETKIDIDRAFKNGLGHALLIVETPGKKRENIVKWIQSTQIGINTISDYEELTAYASDLKTGKPLGDVQISLTNSESKSTNQNGLATLKLPLTKNADRGLLIARRGEDSAILPEADSYGAEYPDWLGKPQKDALRWFVFNDRNMYRPGETVSIKGYLRKFTGGKFADIFSINDAAKRLSYILRDSRGNTVLRGNTDLNVFNAFDFKLKIPENINLGSQILELRAESDLNENSFSHQFQVQEFRRPEFEVSAKVDSGAPFYVGDSTQVTAEAKYFAGGALTNAETNWTVTATPTSYTPPNRDDFTFGKFIPWWNYYYDEDQNKTTTETFKGTTDTDGKHRVAIDFVSANPARPYTLKAEARVQDVNRQNFAASTELLVHPSEFYVGIRTPKTFVRQGEKLKIETITTDVDGKAIAGAKVAIKAELKDWRKIKGSWENVTIDTKTCEIVSKTEAASCEIPADKGGSFDIKASVADNKGRRSESELDVWVTGGNREIITDVRKEEAELIPGKKEYAPNETAEILVNAPFFPAEGVLTLQRNGIVKTERFSMNSASTILQIPITEQYLPNLHVQIDLTGATERIWYEDARDLKLPKRPAFASGELELNISTASRKLNVVAEPLEKTLEPGGKTKIKLSVRDFQGKVVAGSEVAVVAADESVIALTKYEIENPAGSFYTKLSALTSSYYSRENILLSYPENDDENGSGFGYGSGMGNGSGSGSGYGNGSGAPPSPFVRLAILTNLQRPPAKSNSPDQIKLRTNFDALAVFAPSVKTDERGEAIIDVNLPDNLTRYRITAIAATEKQFGKAESNLTAKQPLMIRASAPRFMNIGDTAELPVVLQNQSDSPMTIDVAIRAVNAKLTDGNGRKITIPANDRAEIRFPVISEQTGNARFQIGAVSGNFADAAEFEFPIYTPATTESFATYGTTEQNGAIIQPISAPKNIFPGYGGLEISTSSTQLQELTDAFIYLQNYPFECTEQRSSRVLSVAALRDVLTAFQAKELPGKEQIEAKMNADAAELKKLQHKDGGFSFWRSDDESIPYVSVHVAHALARMKLKNYAVPPEMIQKSLGYLNNIEAKYQSYYKTETRFPISAYALYVRNLLGDKDAGKAKKILKDAAIENISVETLGWILNVLNGDKNSFAEVEAIRKSLLKRVTETSNTAHFVTNYKDGEYLILSSPRRTDAIVLEALLSEQSTTANSSDSTNLFAELIPKLARGLLDGREKGHWSSTQENAFVLLALDKYFRIYEKATPEFVAKVWLGNSFAGAQKYSGRTTETNLTRVPMNYLQAQNGVQNLILDKQGAGRLYYRIGLKYAPKDLRSEAADYGFTVTRKYEAIDNSDDVKQDANGNWTIKSGARIRVKLQMVAPTTRYHVALVDFLPAGFEIVNSALATSESLPQSEAETSNNWQIRYRARWFNHQNLRDNRAEAFTGFLGSGVWNYEYIARATTPGNFTAPPAKAEEMYSPETFGRTGTAFVSVR